MAINRNIVMEYFNGTDYDVLWPQANYQNMSGTKPSCSYSELSGTKPSYSYSEITGSVPSSDLPTVPLTKGGTGQTSATAGLGALIYGANERIGLASNLYIAGASGSNAGYKVSMANLGDYISKNYASGYPTMVVQSYVGTGNDVTVTFPTYSGCILKAVKVMGDLRYDVTYGYFEPMIKRDTNYNSTVGGSLAIYSSGTSTDLSMRSSIWCSFISDYTIEITRSAFQEVGATFYIIGYYSST